MECNKRNYPLVSNNENCDIKECKWRTEDADDEKDTTEKNNGTDK